MEAVLQIEHLTKIYNGEKLAVEDVSLTVEAGEIYGFIGHNGAGKSTTIKSIVGILPVHKGDVFILGKSIRNNLIEGQKQIGYLPDNPDIYDFMTGMDYINFLANIFEVPSEERLARIEKYGDAFEITEQLGDLISTYSHGMKQKVALIGALVHKPKLLILDEPFVGLDPKATATLKACMKELCEEGSAIFFSTHVLDVAEKLCNKIGMMDHGKLVVTGKVSDLTKDQTLEEVFLQALEVANE